MAAEGLLVPDGKVLILSIPIAALALTASSIPVHAQYMQATPSQPQYRQVEQSYISGLLFLTMISLVILIAALFMLDGLVPPHFLIGIVSLFLVEKFSDELTRFYEFRKEFSRWFVTQIVRSAWLFIPIGLFRLGADYETTFQMVAVAMALASICYFFLATGLRPHLSMSGWRVLKGNTIFLSSAGLLAMHRQLPRIAVAHLFPNQAHFFQAVAQIGQGVSLLFNVKYMVPYRALISRRPFMFERRMTPTFTRLMLVAIAMALGAAGAVWVLRPITGDFVNSPALALALIGDALAFSLAASYWGYLPWLNAGRRILVTYGLASITLLIVGSAAYALLVIQGAPIVVVPFFTILISAAWLWIIRNRHFMPGLPNAAR